MSEIPPLADGNLVSQPDNNNSNSFGDELVGNSAFLRALELVVLRNLPRVVIPIFEPLVRRVVKEEIELAQQRFSANTNLNSGEKVISPQLKKLKLRFRSKLSLPILTGKPILGEDDSPAKIDLIDENTGLVVKFGPEASEKVEIVVLRVDSNHDGLEWTPEKFVQNIVTESGKTKSFLMGKTFLNLNQGTGSVDKIYFTHGSSWTKKCEFMLGARFVNNCDGITVKEAKSERFTLEDSRSKLYAKHHPPVLLDEVWRLEKIRKGGKFHKRLEIEKIKTVKDFLIRYFSNPQILQNILQMPDKVFLATVEHGLTCKRNKHIYRPPNSQKNAGVIFDDVGQLLGVLSDNGFVSVEKLSEKAKDDAQTSVAYAFENRGDVVGYIENSIPSTSSLSSEHIVDESHLNYVYDEAQPSYPSTYSTEVNCSMVDLDLPCDLQPSDIDFLREILRSPLHNPETEGPRTRNKKWLKMVLVVRFLLRMRTEKADHVPKKMRFQ